MIAANSVFQICHADHRVKIEQLYKIQTAFDGQDIKAKRIDCIKKTKGKRSSASPTEWFSVNCHC